MAQTLKQAIKKPIVLVILAMLLAVGITRAVSILHGMELHPDEIVFYTSSDRLTNRLLHPEASYKAYKEYPEGAFVLQMPFHLLERVACKLVGAAAYNPQLWGRIAAVFYYMLGCGVGAALLYRYFGKHLLMVGVYALMMVFSLFHIEQSRYGTGDAISLFLLMSMVFSAALFLEKRSGWFLALSGLFVGALGAVKYPQLFFIVIPLGALVVSRQDGAPRSRLRSVGLLAVLLATTVVGFFVLSPSALKDPAFIYRAVTRELDVYTVQGNLTEIGSPMEHLLSLIMYQLFYSDVPLSLFIVVYAVLCMIAKAKKQRDAVKWFFAVVIPTSLLVFFTYNLFVTSMFMRTYYPYFCLCALYAAWGVYSLMARKPLRVALIALLSVMVVRGTLFMGLLSQPSEGTTMLQTLTQHEGWDTRTNIVLFGGRYFTGNFIDEIPEPKTIVGTPKMYKNGLPIPEPGQFFITMPMDYSIAEPYLLPIEEEKVSGLVANWAEFKAKYAPNYITQSYPDWYYKMFGAWIHGTTLTLFEFPTNYLYYFPLTP